MFGDPHRIGRFFVCESCHHCLKHLELAPGEQSALIALDLRVSLLKLIQNNGGDGRIQIGSPLNCYLLTASRRGEIFRWTWNDDVNFERREVRLGTRKTRDGSMSYEWLPMNEELYRELWSWWKNRPIKDSPYVFVSTSNRHHGRPFTTRRRFMKGLCKRAGVKEFGFHALRRYCASLLADEHKISAKTIQRILRHKNLATTERYIHNIGRDIGAVAELLSEKNPRKEPAEVTEEC